MEDAGSPHEPTVAEIRSWPAAERHAWVERIRIHHPQWQAITKVIEECHALQPIAAEPPCLLVSGHSGVGKTTLLTSYAQRYPGQQTATGFSRPVVYATIVPPATVKGLATTLLVTLGDPIPDKGTVTMMTQRVLRFIQHCDVQLLLLDELQHFVDRDSQKMLWTVSNWLKTVIKEARVGCVLAGLTSDAEQVVDANYQLARLFGDPLVLSPFLWDVAVPSTITAFRALLHEIEACLPLRAASALSSEPLAQRCFVASGGVLGYLMALIRRATHLALGCGEESLSLSLLATAFDQRLGGERRQIANPFREDVPTMVVPVTPRVRGAIGGTTRRSQSRKHRT